MTEIIGIIAASCTTIAFVPQVIRTVRTNDTSGISLNMYILFIFGMMLWALYGFLIHSQSVIMANTVTCVLAGIVLFMKVKNLLGERKQKKSL